MKEVIGKLNMAIRVLNNIEIKGKQNLLNLGGTIDLLDSIVMELEEIEKSKPEDKESAE